MASDKETYHLDRYKKRIVEWKEAYKDRKEYLSSFKLPFTEDELAVLASQEQEENTGNTGSAEADDEDVIGNFVGSGELVTPGEHKQYRYTSKFGWRWGRQHYGADLAPLVPGTPGCKILAAGDGVVIKAGTAIGFGQAIVLKHRDDLYTLYGHMPASTIRVKVGDVVKQGQWLADMGKEGRSTGIHLHFEVHTNYDKRYGGGGTVDPELHVDLKTSAASVEAAARAMGNLKIMADIKMDELVYDGEGEMMHDEYVHPGELSQAERAVDNYFRSTYPYQEIKSDGSSLKWKDYKRQEFLAMRIGWGRTTKFENYVPLNKKRFLHQPHYDGYEGNLYSPDAKRVFERLLLKTKKPYFEIISGFRFSEDKQLSPHEAGCAMDILVKDTEEAREIADCAWQVGIRSIGIGGDFAKGKGFIHIDICPKGKDFMYDGVPIYGGPGKWEMK